MGKQTAREQPKAAERGIVPDVSGNPSGRSKDSRDKTTLAIAALLEGEAEGLTRKAIERALEGDATALRLCLESHFSLILIRNDNRPGPAVRSHIFQFFQC